MSVIHITENNFAAEVLQSSQTVLLDFWASWCGPCRMLSPVLDQIAAERPDIKVGKVNVDSESALASRFNIISIPTVILMKNGAPVAQSVGFVPKEQLLALLDK